MEQINIGWSTLQWLVSAGAAFYAWWSSRDAADKREVAELRERMTRAEERISQIPDDDMVHELAGDMKAVRVELTGIRDAIGPLSRSVERINDYLLHKKV
ncbi:DUF2730 family protein [Chitiniphilus shinanonensis]|uniref:DUF2730 family protein n=1 Tax=Chitiniphilus shinanonensis TaxID=553088 RepID=UPI00303408A2